MIDNQEVTLHDIFISYKHKDKYLAKLTAMCLEEMGYDVWWDVELLRKREKGPFPEIISAEINSCKDFILIVTENTFANINNEGDWIRKELTLALNRTDINILPYCATAGAVPSKEQLPPEITKLIDEVVFRNYPDIYERGQDSFTRTFSDELASPKRFRETPDWVKNGLYQPSTPKEDKRLGIQAQNTKFIDDTCIQEVLDGITSQNILSHTKESGLIVLDIGCGNGSVGKDRFIGPEFTKILGIDKDKQVIEQAFHDQDQELQRLDNEEAKTKDEKTAIDEKRKAIRKFKYDCIDIEKDSFKTDLSRFMRNVDVYEKFDIIFIAQVLHFIKKDSERLLLDLKDFLKPGGVIIIRESDDGSKIAYNNRPMKDDKDEAEVVLKEIIDCTAALNNVADRYMARRVFGMLKRCGFENIKAKSFMCDVSGLNETERENLFLECFSWRYDAVRAENNNSDRAAAVKKMKSNLDKLEKAFKSNNDFWFCTYEYVFIANKKS